ALIRSSEYVVPTATSSVQPSGGRSSSSRCCLSSGLSIRRLQTVENVSEQSLANEPPEFQAGRAGIAGPQFLRAGIVYAGQVLLQPPLSITDQQAGGWIVAQERCIARQGEIPPAIDEFARGGCNPRINGEDQFPETLPVPLRQHAGARRQRFRPLCEISTVLRNALGATGLFGQNQVVEQRRAVHDIREVLRVIEYFS